MPLDPLTARAFGVCNLSRLLQRSDLAPKTMVGKLTLLKFVLYQSFLDMIMWRVPWVKHTVTPFENSWLSPWNIW